MKKWFHSKTLWINLIALVAMVVQGITGQEWLDVEAQVAILAGINIILRIFTSQGIFL